MSNVSDAHILNDLEYRGIDDFLSEMEVGLVVPTCFVERIKAIIKENYDIDLVAKPGMLDNLHEGVFCSMPYNDTSVTLVSSYCQRENIMSRMAPITNELTMLYSIVDDLTNLQGSALPLQYQRIDALIEKYELKVKDAQQTSWEDARNAFHTLD